MKSLLRFSGGLMGLMLFYINVYLEHGPFIIPSIAIVIITTIFWGQAVLYFSVYPKTTINEIPLKPLLKIWKRGSIIYSLFLFPLMVLSYFLSYNYFSSGIALDVSAFTSLLFTILFYMLFARRAFQRFLEEGKNLNISLDRMSYKKFNRELIKAFHEIDDQEETVKEEKRRKAT